jgi:hypothetical protein
VIIGSLLLILVAVTLLVLGLAAGSSGLLVSSIGASLLAAVALVVGARQAATSRAAGEYGDGEPRPRAGDEEGRPVHHHRHAAGGRATRRRRASGRGGDGFELAEPVDVTGSEPTAGWATDGDNLGAARQPVRSGVVTDDGGPGGDPDDQDPADEPAAQDMSPADAALVAGMAADVLVIDGRPRYHEPGCEHLLGRESEPLPVREAVALGFTPCRLCEPNSALLADARRA